MFQKFEDERKRREEKKRKEEEMKAKIEAELEKIRQFEEEQQEMIRQCIRGNTSRPPMYLFGWHRGGDRTLE